MVFLPFFFQILPWFVTSIVLSIITFQCPRPTYCASEDLWRPPGRSALLCQGYGIFWSLHSKVAVNSYLKKWKQKNLFLTVNLSCFFFRVLNFISCTCINNIFKLYKFILTGIFTFYKLVLLYYWDINQ